MFAKRERTLYSEYSKICPAFNYKERINKIWDT